MFAIFWTAYVPIVIVLLGVIGPLTLRALRRLSMQLRLAPARSQRL